jgi:hypothetical protein
VFLSMTLMPEWIPESGVAAADDSGVHSRTASVVQREVLACVVRPELANRLISDVATLCLSSSRLGGAKIRPAYFAEPPPKLLHSLMKSRGTARNLRLSS